MNAAVTLADEYWHLGLPGCRNMVIYVHVTWNTLHARDISLGPLTLRVPEAGELVGSILL